MQAGLFERAVENGVPDIRRVVRLALTELPCRDPFPLAWRQTPRYHATLPARSYRLWIRINPGMQRLFVSVRGSDEVLAATYLGRHSHPDRGVGSRVFGGGVHQLVRPASQRLGVRGGNRL